jgi:colanic acid/amylovoran biosynthesis protein
MRVLVLWADDMSPNLGVRVLGAGTAALVRRAWPDAEIVFHNYSAGTAPIRLGSLTSLGLETVTRRKRLAGWFQAFDLVLDTRAGDSFTDIYGIHRLASQVAAAEFAARSGVPVVLTPQTIGPFTSPLGRALGRRSLRTAAVVMARDSISGEAAQRLGRPVDVVATDVVFALPDPAIGPRRDVVLNVSGLLWRDNPHVDAAVYRDTVHKVYDALRTSGRSVTLLAHVLSTIYHGDDDVPAIRAFADEHARDAEVLIPKSLAEVRQAVAGAELVIGSRMHACLNALSAGTPALPLAYSRKFGPLLSDLGWSHLIDLRERGADVAAQVAVLANTDLAAEAAAVRERAQSRLQPAAHLLADDRLVRTR